MNAGKHPCETRAAKTWNEARTMNGLSLHLSTRGGVRSLGPSCLLHTLEKHGDCSHGCHFADRLRPWMAILPDVAIVSFVGFGNSPNRRGSYRRCPVLARCHADEHRTTTDLFLGHPMHKLRDQISLITRLHIPRRALQSGSISTSGASLLVSTRLEQTKHAPSKRALPSTISKEYGARGCPPPAFLRADLIPLVVDQDHRLMRTTICRDMKQVETGFGQDRRCQPSYLIMANEDGPGARGVFCSPSVSKNKLVNPERTS